MRVIYEQKKNELLVGDVLCQGFEAQTASGSIYEAKLQDGKLVLVNGPEKLLNTNIEDIMFGHKSFMGVSLDEDNKHEFEKGRGLSLCLKLEGYEQPWVTSYVAQFIGLR